MNGWFLTVVAIYILSLWSALKNHGKKQEGIHNFWVALIIVGMFLFLIYKAIQTGF